MIKHSLKTLSLLVILLCSFLHVAHAATPQSITYQGYLTDPTGVALDGNFSVQFDLYNISAGGVAQWSDTQAVTVSKGLFSIELGAGTFPLGLFDAPLWLGVNVATDGEMTPRSALTSAAFSFKAEDADTVGGISAGTLDQSAHVIDNTNPHNVSAAQTGAADGATLSTHTGNIANPHSVTAAQTGAADSASFILHVVNSSAHHIRYANTEAVAAMGVIANGNPLNHVKRNDAQVLAAVISQDGAGSTLDADLIDGLQASEIIDAASDEVRTPISSLPFTISAPGSYYLTGNLDGSAGGIEITSDNVTLDLMGFTLDGGGSVNDIGISFPGTNNITIKNGTVEGFGLAGIYQSNPSSNNATVMHVQVLGNGTLGTDNIHSGVYILSNNTHIERCTVGDNGGTGIRALINSKLIQNTAYNNTGSYAIYGYINSSLIGNIAYNNTGTFTIFAGHGSKLSGNIVYNNTSTYAIYGSNGTNIRDNTAYNNTSFATIRGGSGAIVMGNSVYNNSEWGILGTISNLIKDNVIHRNNTSNIANRGGLSVGSDSRVVGNTLNFNRRFNITVNSNGNRIQENHFTDAITGIIFYSGGNYYKDNSASGNTTNYNLNGQLITNGGGNASF